MKRRTLRSICSATSRSSLAATLQRSPISLKSSLKAIPDLHSRKDSVTVSLSLPKQETIPIPVITTRFIAYPYAGKKSGHCHLKD